MTSVLKPSLKGQLKRAVGPIPPGKRRVAAGTRTAARRAGLEVVEVVLTKRQQAAPGLSGLSPCPSASRSGSRP